MKAELRDIIDELYKVSNYDFRGCSPEMLERRIGMRIFATGCTDLSSYNAYLKFHREEHEHLMESITIKVSHFFRNPLDFEIISNVLASKLFIKKQSNESLRIWSAGCAGGEEPYTIAIILAELPDSTEVETEIFATDIDRSVLSRAKKGEYGEESVKEVRYGLLKKYFRIEEDKYKVKEGIKKRVIFSFHDQLSEKHVVPLESIYGDFDLVLCRNMMIYYNQEQRRMIQTKLYASLRAGGYLMLGEAEEIDDRLSDRLRQIAPLSKIYKKIR